MARVRLVVILDALEVGSDVRAGLKRILDRLLDLGGDAVSILNAQVARKK